jgi:hypothetical protein
MLTDIGNRYGRVPTLIVSGAMTGAKAVDVSQAGGDALRLNLVGNVTNLTFTNGMAGMTLALFLVQDAVGGRTVTFNSTVKVAGGAFALTAAAGHADTLVLFCDGVNYIELSRAVDVGIPAVTPFGSD